MKAAVILLLIAAGAFYYFYSKTSHLDPYLEKYAPALLEAKGGPTSTVADGESAQPSTVAASTPTSFLELKSKDGRSIKASIISRGPVGVRATRTDGQTFEIPYDRLDADTVAVINAIQSFPYP